MARWHGLCFTASYRAIINNRIYAVARRKRIFFPHRVVFRSAERKTTRWEEDLIRSVAVRKPLRESYYEEYHMHTREDILRLTELASCAG